MYLCESSHTDSKIHVLSKTAYRDKGMDGGREDGWLMEREEHTSCCAVIY